jgi:predicted transcriptional regulator
VRRARRDRDLTQEVVAARAGTTPKIVSKIEVGQSDSRTTTVLRIIRGLGMSVSEFFAFYERVYEQGDSSSAGSAAGPS